MKVTDPEIIKAGERDLIDAVKEDLDWNAIGEILKKKINISSVESTGGQIVVHNNQVAFQVDLMLKMELSLMFDRDGNHISDNENRISENDDSFKDPDVELDDPIAGIAPSQEQDQSDPLKEPEFDPANPGDSLDGFDLDHGGLNDGSDDTPDDGDGANLDDDIDEILKESREFWENKKTD